MRQNLAEHLINQVVRPIIIMYRVSPVLGRKAVDLVDKQSGPNFPRLEAGCISVVKSYGHSK